MPAQCPVCAGALYVTRLQCSVCGTEVAGAFVPDRLVNVPEPHGSLLELFLRARGNAKEMERALGLSYPTVRARLEEAFAAAGLGKPEEPAQQGAQQGAHPAAERSAVLDALERGEITPAAAATRLRALRDRPDQPDRPSRPERLRRPR